MPINIERVNELFSSRSSFKVVINRNDGLLFPAEETESTDPDTFWQIGISPLNNLRCLEIEKDPDTESDERCMAVVAQQLDLPAICSELTLSKLRLGQDSTQILFEAVGKSRNLIKLLMWRCDVSSEVGESLASAFSQNSRIKLLDLTDCNIGDGGAAGLAEALKVNQSLRKVNLNRNRIADEGAIRLGEALSVNRTLFTLHLGDNRIGATGAAGLAEGLGSNRSLGVLKLDRNFIEQDGAASFSEMLKVNRGLLELDLSWCTIGKQGLNILLGCLQSNSTLLKLDVFEGNVPVQGDTTDEIKAKLAQRIELNKAKQKQLFSEALRNNASGAWGRTRLLFIGQGRAGKTATVRALLRQPFVETHDSTIGADLTQMSTRATNESGWAKESDDFTSRHAARILAEKHFEVEYQEDVLDCGTDTESTRLEEPKTQHTTPRNGLKKKMTAFHRNSNDFFKSKPKRRFSLPGEPGSRRISSQRMKPEQQKSSSRLAAVFNIDEFMKRPYEQTLAFRCRHDREALNFTLWDFGGQEVFYTMHHLFLSSQGVYFLVFNCEDVLKYIESGKNIENIDENPEKYFQFWTSSIAVHAPDAPVFVVGTHLDKIEDLSKLNNLNEFLIETLQTCPEVNIVENAEEGFAYFPVDNKNLVGVPHLQRVIEKEAREQGHVDQQVPIRWMACLDKLFEISKVKPQKISDKDVPTAASLTRMRHQPRPKRTPRKKDGNGKGTAWLPLEQVQSVAESFGITESDEVQKMLQLFNDLGVLVYLNENAKLREKVILKPQWLMDVLGKVIRDNSLHVHHDEFKELFLEEEAKRAFEEGLFSLDLLEFLWRGQDVDFLIQLMQHAMLMSEWDFSPNKEKLYLVPSLLKKLPPKQNSSGTGTFLKKLISWKSFGVSSQVESTSHSCLFDFSAGCLPTGVFERLVCLVVSWEADAMEGTEGLDEPTLAQGFCELLLGDDTTATITLDAENLSINLQMSSTNGEVVSEKTSSRFLKVLEKVLAKINVEVMSSSLKWSVIFSDDGSMISRDAAKAKSLFPWFSVVDGRDFSATLELGSIFDLL